MLFYKTWIVFVYALALSLESIIIEYLTIYYVRISPIVLSSLSITLSGLMLLSVAFIVTKTYKDIIKIFTKSWKFLLMASLSLSLGIFTWYDSINRIGASKEALIAGPIEIILIIFLARIFLKERLNRFQIIGICIGSLGFFLSLASDLSLEDINNLNLSDPVGEIDSDSPLFAILSLVSFGDLEAILSAIGFAAGVIFLGKLVTKHSSIHVAGASMLGSGLILVIFMVIVLLFDSMYTTTQYLDDSPSQIELLSTHKNLLILFLFSLIPFIGSLSYVIGLRRIGASLTATIGSSNLVMVFIIQIALKELGYPSHLPENILLATAGCIMGFLGIFIIHMTDFISSKSKKHYQ
ncbi:EamA family transporter [Candidatus Nitrosocosmicus franklandus]|uniref:EamA-like transporter family protein n=1 Tax=Candidatus Nitrosocosmicus franklandianus TaxID=1798806 RepID=A0A484IFY5_9ARCH|nr:EamA family transporter [Candidatus Nitrosocosmicus franklandus]VFJ14921.1 EamA-like transporter family protein [Candidatus Nitrosocosmicus franklandus]